MVSPNLEMGVSSLERSPVLAVYREAGEENNQKKGRRKEERKKRGKKEEERTKQKRQHRPPTRPAVRVAVSHSSPAP